MITKLNQIFCVRTNSTPTFDLIRKFSFTLKNDAGKLWRQSVGLSKLQTARGPIIDLPDYSFVDGRAVPPSTGQLERKELQKKLTLDIVTGLNYLNRASTLMKEKESAIPKILPYIEKTTSTTQNRPIKKKSKSSGSAKLKKA